MKNFKKCICPCNMLKIGDKIIYSDSKPSIIIDIRKNNKTTTKVFCKRGDEYYVINYPNDLKITIERLFKNERF